MIKQATIWLPNAQNTKQCGFSLVNSLYKPADILIYGEIGAGKTTFLSGFAKALGINQHLQSPTFALENRYNTANRGEVLHLDLYRLNTNQAQELYEQTDNFEGLRCIEWPERLNNITREFIEIKIEDPSDIEGRKLDISFNDIAIPSNSQIEEWRAMLCLPDHISSHCDSVANYCIELGESITKKYKIVRMEALYKSAQIHDLFRFMDFVEGASHIIDNKKEPEIWNDMRIKYKSLGHEAACAQFCEEKGFKIIGDIIKSHGLKSANNDSMTIEQKILFYADKRLIVDKKVTLQERFDDFVLRYGNGKWTEFSKKWFKKAKELEIELLN